MTSSVEESISTVRRGITMHMPLFSMPILQIEIVRASSQKTGKYACTDGNKIYYNERTFEKICNKQKAFIIIHEVMHCILFHISRRGQRNRYLYNVAADIVINYWIVNVLQARYPSKMLIPKDLIYYDKIDDINVEGLSTEEVYDIISKSGGFNSVCSGEDVIGEIIENGAEQDGPLVNVNSIDIKWKNIANQMIAASKMMGTDHLGLEQLISGAMTPLINWKRKLAKFLTENVKVKLNWSRPSRKWIHESIHMPSRRSKGIGKILVVFDTSGSVPDKDISQFITEINSILKFHNCELILACCDTEFKIVDKDYKPSSSVMICGRGGTSFIEPFEWVKDQGDISVLIYFTDSFGLYPEKTTVNTLWVLTSHVGPNSDSYPPFGEVAYFERNQE
jgi:predicted metal-dependent peptidase